jgi:hypothetical protein
VSATQQMLLPDTIEEKFQRWIRSNPETVEHVRQLALKWHRAGHTKCGIGMLCEVTRWDSGVQGRDEDGLKVNNSYRALLSRHLLATTPELPVDFFETRVRPSVGRCR